MPTITTKQTTIDDYAPLQDNASPIELRIDILGNLQTATTVVRWAGQQKEDLFDSFSLPLGTASDLRDAVLYVDTVVTDTNTDPDDNYTGLRIQLKGGPQTFDRTLSSVIDSGNSEAYSIKITFYAI
jgi:hypothetical protein